MKTKKLLSETTSKTAFLICATASFIESLIKKLEDKKLSWSEKIQLIIELKPFLEVIPYWQELQSEIKELAKGNLDEYKDLVNTIQQNLDLENDKVEIIIKTTAQALLSIFEVIKNLKNT